MKWNIFNKNNLPEPLKIIAYTPFINYNNLYCFNLGYIELSRLDIERSDYYNYQIVIIKDNIEYGLSLHSIIDTDNYYGFEIDKWCYATDLLDIADKIKQKLT